VFQHQHVTLTYHRAAVASALKGRLTSWSDDMPDHLKIVDHNTMLKALPNVLMLHTEYWCATIMLYQPFLTLPKVQTDLIDRANATKSPAWEQCIDAAQHINDIAKAWSLNFLFKHASAFFVYDVFHAGIIWVAALSCLPVEPQFILNLEFCLEALDEMKVTHPLAAHCHHQLQGASVSPGEQQSGSLRYPETFRGSEFSGSSRDKCIVLDSEQFLSPILTGEHSHPLLMNEDVWSDLPLDHAWREMMRSSTLTVAEDSKSSNVLENLLA